MITFKQFICEMAVPRDSDKKKKYYHGTSELRNINGIIKDGINTSQISIKYNSKNMIYKPVKDLVYCTTNLAYAISYCLNSDSAGKPIEQYSWMAHMDDSPRVYGYLCVIDGNSLNDIHPDEDSIGELISKQTIPWLNELAIKLLDENTYNKVIKHKSLCRAWIKAGKIIFHHLTDEQKYELFDNNSHVANDGVITPKEIWKFDKRKVKLLLDDGSNFFKLAKRIK